MLADDSSEHFLGVFEFTILAWLYRVLQSFIGSSSHRVAKLDHELKRDDSTADITANLN